MLCIYSLANTEGTGYRCHHPSRRGGECAVDSNGIPRECGSLVAYPQMSPRRVSAGKYRFYDSFKRDIDGNVQSLVDIKVDHHGIFERIVIDPDGTPFTVEAAKNIQKLRDACNYAIGLMTNTAGRVD